MTVFKRIAAGVLLLLLLQGCGRKGPLFMPKPSAKPVPVAPQPAPMQEPIISTQPETSKLP